MMPRLSITPIILAAGDSTRMGYPKALLPFGHGTFLTRILETIQRIGLADPTIILGKAAAAIRPCIKHSSASILINPDPDRGQLSSIQLGLSSVPPGFLGAMIWPVDQPAISEDLVRGLVQLFLESEPLIAFPRFGQKRGHPAIFHRALFKEFIETPLEEGPKNILSRHARETAEIVTNEPGVVEDIDTPAEYEALTGETLESALRRTGRGK